MIPSCLGRIYNVSKMWASESEVQRVAWNCTIMLIHTQTHVKSSSDPSPFPAVMSLADWLSLAIPSPTSFLLLREARVFFRDFILDLLCPGKDCMKIQPGHSSSKARSAFYFPTTLPDCSAEAMTAFPADSNLPLTIQCSADKSNRLSLTEAGYCERLQDCNLT